MHGTGWSSRHRECSLDLQAFTIGESLITSSGDCRYAHKQQRATVYIQLPPAAAV
jgi:hypothetical protein